MNITKSMFSTCNIIFVMTLDYYKSIISIFKPPVLDIGSLQDQVGLKVCSIALHCSANMQCWFISYFLPHLNIFHIKSQLYDTAITVQWVQSDNATQCQCEQTYLKRSTHTIFALHCHTAFDYAVIAAWLQCSVAIWNTIRCSRK